MIKTGGNTRTKEKPLENPYRADRPEKCARSTRDGTVVYNPLERSDPQGRVVPGLRRQREECECQGTESGDAGVAQGETLA